MSSKNTKQGTLTHHRGVEGRGCTSADSKPLTNIDIKTRKHALFDKETRKLMDEAALSTREPVQTNVGNSVSDTSDKLKASANKLYQDAKSNLEQSGNLKTSIKEQVILSLTGMYEIILQFYESGRELRIQLERGRTESQEDLLQKEKEYAGRIEALASAIKEADWRSPVSEIINEVKSLRQALYGAAEQPSTDMRTAATHII